MANHLERQQACFIWQRSGHTPSSREIRIGTQGQNPASETDGEAMLECYILSCSSWLTQPASLYRIRPPSQRWFLMCLALLCQSLIKKMYCRLAYRQSDENTEVLHPRPLQLASSFKNRQIVRQINRYKQHITLRLYTIHLFHQLLLWCQLNLTREILRADNHWKEHKYRWNFLRFKASEP